MKAKSVFWKRLGAAALAAGVIVGTLTVNALPVSAAKKFQVTKEKYEKSYELEDGTVYYELSYEYPVVSGSSAAAKKINSAIEKQRKVWVKEAEKAKDDYKEEVGGYLKDYPDEKRSWKYTDDVNFEVTNNDGKYFSVLMSGYLFTGGAHGMPYRICATFDAKTGEKLTAAKLLGTTKAKLNDKVKKLYLKKLDKEGAEAGFYSDLADGRSDKEVLQEGLKTLNFNNAFYMKKGKLVFYADPYALGPYAAGFIEVTASVK